MKRSILKIGVLILAACLLLTGCGAGKTRSTAENGYYYDDGDYSYEASYAADEDIYYGPEEKSADYDSGDPVNVDPNAVQQGLKIIYRSRLDIETLTYEESLAAVKKAISVFNGYIQSTNEYGGIYYSSGYTYRRYSDGIWYL